MLNILAKSEVDTNKSELLNLISRQFWQTGEYEKAKRYGMEELRLAEKINYKKGELQAYTNLGIINENQGLYQEATKNFEEVIKISSVTGNKRGMANGYLELGNICYLQGNSAKALEYYILAIRLNEEVGEKYGIASGHIGIGVIYMQSGNYSESIKHYLEALAIEIALGDRQGIAYCNGNIGLLHYYQHNYSEGLRYYSEALKISLEIGDQQSIANANINIGLINQALGKYPEALKSYFSSLKSMEKIGNKEGISNACISIGELKYILEKAVESRKYLERALSLSKETGSMENCMKSYYGLARLDSSLGNYKKSLGYFKYYSIYKDSLFNEKSSQKLAELQLKYKSEENDKEIKLLTVEREIQGMELKKQKLINNAVVGGLFFLVILSFVIYLNYRTGQKLKLENIRNGIAADLHDDIGSTLNSISLFSEVAIQQAGKPVQALDEIGRSARKVIEALGDIVWTINLDNDSFENVIERMRSFSYSILNAKSIEFIFKVDENLNGILLPITLRKNFYLIFKEAINNLVKYSGATFVSIHISIERKKVRLVIHDNGSGFDMDNSVMGNGIRNMQKRALEMRASLTVESSIGKGTDIELNFKT